MIEELLQLNGLSTEILERLSYPSHLGKSLKNNLHNFDHDQLMNELQSMRYWLLDRSELAAIVLDYRIKSMDSIELKYQKYHPNRQVRQVFNDILGFRAFCDDYRQLFTESSQNFRIVNMSSGKANDDGYRGVHLYYEKDHFHYPIEIQFNTLYDRQINNWLHAFLYKSSHPDEIGRQMRAAYECGRIRNAGEFEEVLQNVLSDRQAER